MTTMQKRHSFIVCAYKESPYLRDCILSLKNQTVPSMIKIATSTPNEYIEKTAAEFGLDVLINKKMWWNCRRLEFCPKPVRNALLYSGSSGRCV